MIDEDFYEFDGKDFLHLFPRSQVNDDNVVALLPDGDNSFLMVTENNGLFRTRNILIDQSFETKLKEAEEAFVFKS